MRKNPMVALAGAVAVGVSFGGRVEGATIVPADWDTVESGKIAGVDVSTTGFSFPSPTSPSIEVSSFTGGDFSAAPLSNVEVIENYISTDDWTVTFNQTVSELLLYASSWRGTTTTQPNDPPTSYTFNSPFKILSGFSGAVVSGNTLTIPDTGLLVQGILEFTEPITFLSVESEREDEFGGGQSLTFALRDIEKPEPVPEPASLLGLAAIGAVAAGGALKKKAA